MIEMTYIQRVKRIKSMQRPAPKHEAKNLIIKLKITYNLASDISKSNSNDHLYGFDLANTT